MTESAPRPAPTFGGNARHRGVLVAGMIAVLAPLALLGGAAPSATAREAAPFRARRPAPVADAPRFCPRPPPPQSPHPLPPGSARRMTFDLDVLAWKNSGFRLRVGTLTVVRGADTVVDGKKTFPLRARADSSGFGEILERFDAHMVSYVDARTLKPVRFANELSGTEPLVDASFDSRESVAFARGAIAVRYRRLGHEPAHRQLELQTGDDVVDVLSILDYVRSRELSSARDSCFLVYNRMQLWRIEGRFVGVDTLHVPAMTRRARRFEATATEVSGRERPRHVTVWLSDDAERLPLRIESPFPPLTNLDVVLASVR